MGTGLSKLLSAAAAGQHKEVQKLVKRGVDVNARTDENGTTALYRAAANGHIGVVKLLLNANADVNKPNDMGETPLCEAAAQGRASIIAMLLDAGADVNKADLEGTTPLCMAAERGHADVIPLLLRAGADVHKTSINGASPLALAASNDHASVVQLLLRANADVNGKDSAGETPLCRAAARGHAGVVRVLLTVQAWMLRSDMVRAVTYAARANHAAVVDALLLVNSSVDGEPKLLAWDVVASNRPALTPGEQRAVASAKALCLGLAVRGGDAQQTQYFLRLGASPNESNQGLLHEAMAAAQYAVAVELIRAPATDLDCRNEMGRSVLTLAIEGGHVDIVRELVRAKVDVNAKDQMNVAPLHVALDMHQLQLLPILLDADDVDVSVLDAVGVTLWAKAQKLGFNDVASRLREMATRRKMQDEESCSDPVRASIGVCRPLLSHTLAAHTSAA
ncbi:hypothetical protein SDRG_11982 [Saprolegnia diclina VS20]|uniref:Uncharacterized protein n=1 Tax=Saprolegnia diclina (strain VS20) TaxID=1156394 RepID=T0RKB7_SAPDV|nr:hypothetical protein SDRG_11982 [Saprolegnia diclina VS20]EQC30407.1 hypothetical protein SDRG_11982 [Saprolegnia diclina VS20]|eukprot:XP_008616260.1 hypothetical protein SDRG_11982 [Saprolegnia diclina VS20]